MNPGQLREAGVKVYSSSPHSTHFPNTVAGSGTNPAPAPLARSGDIDVFMEGAAEPELESRTRRRSKTAVSTTRVTQTSLLRLRLPVHVIVHSRVLGVHRAHCCDILADPSTVKACQVLPVAHANEEA